MFFMAPQRCQRKHGNVMTSLYKEKSNDKMFCFCILLSQVVLKERTGLDGIEESSFEIIVPLLNSITTADGLWFNFKEIV